MLVFFDVNGARRSVKNTLSEATAASRSSLTSEYLGYRAADKNAPSKTTATSAPAKVPNASAATSGKFASAASEVLYSEVASLGVANNITCSTLTSAMVERIHFNFSPVFAEGVEYLNACVIVSPLLERPFKSPAAGRHGAPGGAGFFKKAELLP